MLSRHICTKEVLLYVFRFVPKNGKQKENVFLVSGKSLEKKTARL